MRRGRWCLLDDADDIGNDECKWNCTTLGGADRLSSGIQSHLLPWKAQESWLLQAYQCGTACIAPPGQVQAKNHSWWAIEVL